ERAACYADRIIKLDSGKIVSDTSNECASDLATLEASVEVVSREHNLAVAKKSGIPLLWAIKLGLGIVRKHKMRLVAIALLPALFVGMIGMMLVLFSFEPNRKQLDVLYGFETETQTMLLRPHWTESTLPGADGSDEEYPSSIVTRDGKHPFAFFAEEQIKEYQKYGKVVWGVGNTMVRAPSGKIPDMPSTPFEALYVGEYINQVVLWDGERGNDFAQIDAKRLLAGREPGAEGGVMVSDFLYNTYEQYGYVQGPQNIDSQEIASGSMQDFLDKEPLVQIAYKDTFDSVETVRIVQTPIVGIYETVMNVQSAKEWYDELQVLGDKNSPLRTYAPVSANMVVVDKGYFETQVSQGSEPKYSTAIVAKSGHKARDMRYVRHKYQVSGEGFWKKIFYPSSESFVQQSWQAMSGAQFASIGDKEIEGMAGTGKDLLDALKIGFPIFVGVTLLLSFYFAASTIAANKKQIGILRSLGASGKDVLGVYAVENLFASLLTFVVGAVAMNLMMHFVFGFSGANFAGYFGGFVPRLWHYGVLFAGVLATIALGVWIPLLRIGKQSVVDAVRQGSH
ncbi:MAG: ABC transporter permease, partial [Firmicutes bacterium]|nr:ABC transporter permease [Bacillota bacterium]